MARVRADRTYLAWVLKQPWLATRYPQVAQFLRDQEWLGPADVMSERLYVCPSQSGQETDCLACGRMFTLAAASLIYRVGRELIGHVCLRCLMPRARTRLRDFAREELRLPYYELPDLPEVTQ